MTLGATPFIMPSPETIARDCADRYAREQALMEARIASGLAVAPPNDHGRAGVYQVVLEELRKALRLG